MDGDPDYEPWVTDGTAAGTMQLAELHPPSNTGTDSLGAEPAGFTQVAGSQVVFLASTGSTQTGLFATDGTGAGTVELLAGLSNYNQGVTGLADGRAVLVTPSPTSNDTGPRRAYGTDGTGTGTVALLPGVDVGIGDDSTAPVVLPFGSDGLLIGRVDGTANIGLWLTDGTTSGTTLLSGLGSVGETTPGYAPTFGTRKAGLCPDPPKA